jgi:hypothetical protein
VRPTALRFTSWAGKWSNTYRPLFFVAMFRIKRYTRRVSLVCLPFSPQNLRISERFTLCIAFTASFLSRPRF